MKNFQLYIGGTNDITYRYDIKKVDDTFSVSIFNIVNRKHIEDGYKTLRNISASDVIDECESHYQKKATTSSSWVYSALDYLKKH